MAGIIKDIRDVIPKAHIHSLMIGVTAFGDKFNSLFMDVNKQVKLACKMILEDKKLENGYHGLGISQGGQFLRAVAQRCPHPPMFNLITLGSQHQGYYDVGQIKYHDKALYLAKHISYWVIIRSNIVVAQNWHDPIDYKTYAKKNTFIADINNEKKKKKEEYRTHLLRLKNLVLVKFTRDEKVVPLDSSWFGFYTNGQDEEITQMTESQLYKEDWIGLKELDEKGRLHLLERAGRHLEFTSRWFKQKIVKKWLAPTYWKKEGEGNPHS
ncbi:palmitoyl-protein thioesterase 1-like [Macrosteles quadrilineatus]|uniref:palmitoyl-protein thioesterase 1-like n=1 Tax=Macrosteles quadrilineatus TaxID=74068 RepID=UPI0023E27E6A|nr:palmitoyl-protein thioesterase 1-like [Macrosteles quadrilineatus]